ncbi:MAG TPA: hypothetical protein VHS96_12795, partial [Bacteroidia bacterium]|nr:hypothetical protein [Bacteroidia bacterium]
MNSPLPTPTLHPAEDYNFLRQEALAHIQKLSGKLWTDYNTHDPGITMLEILAFAVADLGFRTGHPIKDILSPINEKEERLKQFFTLAEIATTRPWGVTDYRKLLLDLDDVANAWLARATEQEVRIYLDRNRRTFSLSNESIVGGEEIRLNGLYEVAIRFEEDPEFGDLNDNSMRFWVDIPQPAGNVATEVEVEFPFFNRLPERLRKLKEADLDRISEIADHQIGAIPDETLAWFVNLVVPEDESEQGLAQYEKEIQLEIRLLQPQDRLLSLGTIVSTLKNHLWWKEILADHYLPRLQHIQEKLAKVRQILLAHRNLCEDYFAIVTMDLQEISVNVDVEVRPGTDLEATETA